MLEARSLTSLIFSVFLVHPAASAVGVPFLPSGSSPLGFSFNRGFIGANGEDGAAKTRGELGNPPQAL